jgi:hypothetical protein
LNCSQNSHGVKIKSPPHSAGQSYTLTLPSSVSADTFLKTDGSGNLSFASAGGTNTPAFHAYKTATQNVTSNTFTKAEFDVETYDSDGNYASNRFTPQTAGKYFVYANLHLDGSSYPDHLETAIYKNGSMIATSFVGQAGNYIYGNRLVQTTVDMNGSSDYLEVYGKVRQSGSTHFAGGEVRKYFGGYKLIT